MKALVVLLLALAAIVALAPPAAAQQQGSLVLALGTPDGALMPHHTLVIQGIATLTVDLTAALATSGIPVSYHVDAAPAWASVSISPANDVFPTPTFVPGGLSYTVTRTFVVTVSVADGPANDVVDALAISAVTTPGPFGASIMGRASTVVHFDAPDGEPCPEHALTEEQLAEWAKKAEAAYDEYQASRPERGDEEVTTQSTGASPVSLPWAAVAGFALAGAGVGLLLRRRLAR